MRGFPTDEQVKQIKEMYPVGTIIELTAEMNDPYYPIEKGMQGEVIGIDDIGTLIMKWKNGRSLGVIPFEDSFKVISKSEEQEIKTPKMEIGEMGL